MITSTKLSEEGVLTKQCTRCKRTLPLSNDHFWRDTSKAIGFYAVCKHCQSEKAKKWHRAVRMEVLQHYSSGDPKCFCCDEDTYEFLCIDHIGGGGTKHRKEFMKHYAGIAHYLKKNGFPPGYRVACQNCNAAIGLYGFCPHELRRIEDATN